MKPVALPYPDTLETIGDHIKTRRLDLGLYQRDVAQQLGVKTETVTNWEKHHSSPMLHLIPRIIGFLGYDPITESGEEASLGERIVRARRARGIRQEDLSRQLGVDPGTLAKWERGAREPAPRYGVLLEHLLELSVYGVNATVDN